MIKQVEEQKWAILIELAEDDHIYVTEDTGNCMDLHVRLWDDVEEAMRHAKQFPKAWVVSYDD